MRIADVKTYVVANPPPHKGGAYFVFLKLTTDDNVEGFGEVYGVPFHPDKVTRLIEDVVERYVVGWDPFRIESMWRIVYSSGFSQHPDLSLVGVLSGIDIALWDIAGKNFGVPAYQLLGGKTRDKARVYYHVIGDTREKLVQGIKDARAAGFTAVGHLTPFLDESRDLPYFKTHVDKMRDAIEAVAAYREAAGDEVDLCIEIHRQLTPAEAVVLARGIEPYHPMFYEDPILPDNFDAMAGVASQISIPIATGERLHSIHEFEMLLQRGAVQYPDGTVHQLVEKRLQEMARVARDFAKADEDDRRISEDESA